MLDALSVSLESIGVILGSIASLVAIILFFRQRQFSRGALKVSIGSFDRSEIPLPRELKTVEPDLMVIVPERKHPQGIDIVIALPIGLRNNGAQSLTNCHLSLQYDAAFLLDNETIVSLSRPSKRKVGSRPGLHTAMSEREIADLYEHRLASQQFGMAQVIYEIPVLRPGEAIQFWEMFRLRDGKVSSVMPRDHRESAYDKIVELIRGVTSIDDYFPVRLTALADDLPAQRSVVAIMRLKHSHDPKDVMTSYTEALWLGSHPPAGTYHSDPLLSLYHRKRAEMRGRGLYRQHVGILSYPKLSPLVDKAGWLVEYPMDTEIQLFGYQAPNCNWYALPSAIDTSIKLTRWMGHFLLWPRKAKPN